MYAIVYTAELYPMKNAYSINSKILVAHYDGVLNRAGFPRRNR